MRRYVPNPKHETAGAGGRRGTRLDLTALQASQLLNDPFRCVEVPGKRQLVAVANGKIYVFQEDGAGGYHAYPVSGNEAYVKYPGIAGRIAALLGVSVKRLSNMHH